MEKEVTRHNDRVSAMRRRLPTTTGGGRRRTSTETKDSGPATPYYLLKDSKPYLTFMTTARGTEAILPMAHIMDCTAYGRQQDWEDSPEGWPQEPTYGWRWTIIAVGRPPFR